MHCLRRSRLPGAILLLVLGFGVLLPEIGHSVAHRHSAAHPQDPRGDDHGHGHHHDGPEADEVHGQPDMLAVGTQTVAVHPHFELHPISPTKPSLLLALAAGTVAEFILDATEPASPVAPSRSRPVLILRSHGPPLPSRAPPLS